MASERAGRRARLVLAIVVAWLSVSIGALTAQAAEPSAADKETARHLMKLGEEKLAAKDYKAALSSFESAHLIMGVPTTGLAVARARAGLGQLVEARDLALEIARAPSSAEEPAAFEQARAEAGSLAASLEGRIASLEVEVLGAKDADDLEVSIGGHLVPPLGGKFTRRLNPGAHVVTVVAGGSPPASARVTLAEGAKESLTLTVGGGAQGGADFDGDSIEGAARHRDGLFVGGQAAPILALPLVGGAWFGGAAALLVNHALSPRVDVRFGAAASMFGTTGGQGVLAVTMPVSLRLHVTSRYTIGGGFNGGVGHVFAEFPETGFVGGPEWVPVGIRLGDRREIEIDFVQGFRFGQGETYYNGFALTLLLLDD